MPAGVNVEQVRQRHTPADARRLLMEQVLDCVDAAIGAVQADPEAALDDLVAARLLLVTALATG